MFKQMPEELDFLLNGDKEAKPAKAAKNAKPAKSKTPEKPSKAKAAAVGQCGEQDSQLVREAERGRGGAGVQQGDEDVLEERCEAEGGEQHVSVWEWCEG